MKFRIEKNWRWLVALGAMLVPGIVAGAFELPHTFKAGTPIKASEMNENFAAIAAKLDAVTTPPLTPQVGTLSLQGGAIGTPIYAFSMDVQTPFTLAGGAAKPQFSPIVVRRDVDEKSPGYNLSSNQGKALVATIVLGNLTIDLDAVHIVGTAVVAPRAGIPQEELSLTFTRVRWTWQEPDQPELNVDFDLTKAGGSGSAPSTFSFGYFPPGVPTNPVYIPILGYEHTVACASPTTGCKQAHGPVKIRKGVDASTLAELSQALLHKSGVVASLDWFKDETTVNNSLLLGDVAVTGVTLSTAPDGALSESAAFAYTTIKWTVGQAEAGWDVAKNGAL